MWLHLISASTDYVGCFTEGPNRYLQTLCLSSSLWCKVNTKIMISYNLKLTMCLPFKETISPINTTNFSYHSHAFNNAQRKLSSTWQMKVHSPKLQNRKGIQLSNMNRFLCRFVRIFVTLTHVHTHARMNVRV